MQSKNAASKTNYHPKNSLECLAKNQCHPEQSEGSLNRLCTTLQDSSALPQNDTYSSHSEQSEGSLTHTTIIQGKVSAKWSVT